MKSFYNRRLSSPQNRAKSFINRFLWRKCDRVHQGLTVEAEEPREKVRQAVTVVTVEPREKAHQGVTLETVETVEADDEVESSATQQSELLSRKHGTTYLMRSRSRECARPSTDSSSSHRRHGALKEEKQGDFMARSHSVERRSRGFIASPTRVGIAVQFTSHLRKVHESSNTDHGRHSASLSASPFRCRQEITQRENN